MTSAATARLFIALMPNDRVRSELATWRDAWTWPRSAAPVQTAKLHMTLHFLGDVALDRVPELQAALPIPLEPFVLALSEATLWPHGVAVLEPQSVPAALTALHESIAAALRRLNVPVEARPYRPHVTLARRTSGAVQKRQLEQVSWKIDRYALMSSTPALDGSYTNAGTFHMSGERVAKNMVTAPIR